MPNTIPFLTDLRLFKTDDADIESRLRLHLEEIRYLSSTEGGQPKEKFRPLVLYDKNRIHRRAQKIIAARRRYGQGQHLSRTDRKLLKPVECGAIIEGPGSEHAVDEIASQLFEEMPWMQQVIQEIWLDMRHHVVEGGVGLKLRPTLLVGGAGLGKTHLVRRLAELSKLPTVHIDGGTGSEAFPVSGLPRGWSGAECGRPLKTMLSKAVANPVVIIDEVDKAGVVRSSVGHSTSLHSALLGLLESVSARDWPCPYFQVGFDMSHINWLMTCNDPERLPMLLRSRLRTIFVTPPSARQIGNFIEKEAIRRNMSPDDTECLIKKLHEQDRGIQEVSVRLVIRMMDELHRLATLPVKH